MNGQVGLALVLFHSILHAGEQSLCWKDEFWDYISDRNTYGDRYGLNQKNISVSADETRGMQSKTVIKELLTIVLKSSSQAFLTCWLSFTMLFPP